MIVMALKLVNGGGVSFRSVGRIFAALNLSFNLKLRIPSHATVLMWMKKQGVYTFKSKEFFASEKWVLIIDESVQFGNKKLLVALAVNESKLRLQQALNYKDLIPLTIKASESWKSEAIKEEILSHIDVRQISYAVSDNGNNLKGCYQLMGLLHIEDVGHKFSWFIKQVFEKQIDFEGYTKHLSGLRGKLSLTRVAHIIPPNQRIISRFMNLTPLFKWGCRVLELLDHNRFDDEEVEKVKFVLQYRTFILNMGKLLATMNLVQKILKTKQLCIETVQLCHKELEKITNDVDGEKIVQMIKNYLADNLQKLPQGVKGLCSSDIIESCFGKYKEVVKANKSVGITDLCLSIACLTSDSGYEQTKIMLETVKVKQVKQWKQKNIGETLLAKRNNLFRKTG